MVFLSGSFCFVFSLASADAQSGDVLFLAQVLAQKLPLTRVVVTTTADELNNDGDCSLREAIQATNIGQAVDNCLVEPDTELLILPAGIYTLTLAGAHEDANLTGDLDITGTLTISGVGGSSVINGNQLDRVLQVLGDSQVTLHAITVTNGKTPNGTDVSTEPGEPSEAGGGIANAGALTLIASTVISNSTGNGGASDANLGGASGSGGAIFNSGALTVSQSLITHNWTGNGGVQNNTTCILNPGSQAGSGGGIHNATGATALLSASTIRQNRSGHGGRCFLPVAGGNGGDGGGIANFGAMTLENSTVSHNQAANGQYVYSKALTRGDNGGQGGGILNQGSLRVRNSTLSGNRTGDGGRGLSEAGNGGNGGGIANLGSLQLEYVTISQNATGVGGFGGYGGGLYAESAVVISNALLGGNSAAQAGADCTGLLKTYGTNLLQDRGNCAIIQLTAGDLISKNPLLAPLADNGGPNWTHALQTTSPALNVAGCSYLDSSPVTQDQRGLPRPQGNDCDLGAFELSQ